MSGMLLVFYQYFGILLKRDPKEAVEYEFPIDITHYPFIYSMS